MLKKSIPKLDFQFSPRQEVEAIPCSFAALGARQAPNLTMRREFYSTGDTTGTHLHIDFCALYVVKGGRGTHLIDEVPFGIARGDVYLLPPATRHSYNSYQELEIDAFYFPLELWTDEELRALREVSGFWQLFLESKSRRLHLRPEMHRQVEGAIKEMREEAIKNERATPLLLRALLFRLLITLARSGGLETGVSESSPNETPSSSDSKLADLLAWCEANVEREISVAQLAGRMFLSSAHFARLWKREIGMPPAAYLRRLKLERARDLLENSSQSVAHIARAVGFESAAHFSRSFRTHYGVSPLQFRRSIPSKVR
ncbi:helix-turn-helix domain-containing protein [bacterium]|nr:MAG: helix-turn-helix domain-containing protein [bacterium]